jgi:hypothetical protein
VTSDISQVFEPVEIVRYWQDIPTLKIIVTACPAPTCPIMKLEGTSLQVL